MRLNQLTNKIDFVIMQIETSIETDKGCTEFLEFLDFNHVDISC